MGHGLDARRIEVRFPAGASDSSLLDSVQTGSGAHPHSCAMGAGGSFSGEVRPPWHDADHSALSIA
jgi:hypothetical protein